MQYFIFISILFWVAATSAWAQEIPAGSTLAATLEVYAFPQQGQTAEQQATDEAACYDWAVAQTGSDPIQLKKPSVAQGDGGGDTHVKDARTGRGAGVAGALGGAARGAIIGDIIDDDAGKGAAIGAAAGGIRGRRLAKRQRASSQAQKNQEQRQAAAAKIENFKKAFGACLEAKEYTVKF